MVMAAVEEFAPSRLGHLKIVREELRRGLPQQFVSTRSVELREDCRIDLCHALMLEHVLEHFVLVDGIAPFDGLIDHHEEEPVHGLRKEQFEQLLILDAVCKRHLPGSFRRKEKYALGGSKEGPEPRAPTLHC